VQNEIVESVKIWLKETVIGLNLCPFANREWQRKSIRFQVSAARSEQQLLQDLVIELALLKKEPSIETTLLILPDVLQEFDTYNQFLDFADQMIEAMNMAGQYQIASFHPDYQFADTEAEDAQNYTNRSPYPILHILREASLEKAIQSYGDTEQIPENNVKLMNELGVTEMARRLEQCYPQENQ